MGGKTAFLGGSGRCKALLLVEVSPTLGASICGAKGKPTKEGRPARVRNREKIPCLRGTLERRTSRK